MSLDVAKSENVLSLILYRFLSDFWSREETVSQRTFPNGFHQI